MDSLIIICILILLPSIIRSCSKTKSPKLIFSSWGFNRVPSLLLKLAKIEKDGEVDYKDLDKKDQEKLDKYIKKFSKASFAGITFLYYQGLIHVENKKRSSFISISKYRKELVQEKIGNLDENIFVEFIVHRQIRGLFRSPILTGYLKESGGVPIDRKEEIEILFRFPEALLTRIFFTGILAKRYGLKKESFADAGGKDDLGYDQEIYFVTYEQKDEGGAHFHFYIES